MNQALQQQLAAAEFNHDVKCIVQTRKEDPSSQPKDDAQF
jgi:hypothetical protein